MAADGGFKYRYGLSFPGVISKDFSTFPSSIGWGAKTTDFRAEIVEPIANDMRTHCNGKKSKVLYDRFHDYNLARDDLKDFLAKEYLCCELVVVFLCKDYIQKEWCIAEWETIQLLAQCKTRSFRVMYLWRGPMEDQVLARLGLSRNSDGFLHIDNLTPDKIWRKILKRYKKNKKKEQQLLSGSQAAIITASDWKGDDYRLQLVVNSITRCGKQTSSQGRFTVASRLITPEGEAFTLDEQKKPGERNQPDDKLDRGLDRRALAQQVLTLYELARIKASADATDKGENQDSSAKHQKGDHLMVLLALPVELLCSPELFTLLDQIRACCQPSAEHPTTREPPPIALACSERITARSFAKIGSSQGSFSERWLFPARKAIAIADQIIGRGGQAPRRLASLCWWAYRDAAGQNPLPQNTLPQQFLAADATVLPGDELEHSPLTPCYGDEGRYAPEALYLNWQSSLAQGQTDLYSKRLKQIIHSGLPLFLLDCHGLKSTESLFYDQQASQAEQGHPFDVMLRWHYAELITQSCHFHRMIKPPQDPAKATLWHYLRHSLLFWEDHRCDFVPTSPEHAPGPGGGDPRAPSSQPMACHFTDLFDG